MGSNDDAEKEDFDEKKAELEEIVNPILQEFYQQHGGMGGEAGGDDDWDDDDLADHDNFKQVLLKEFYRGDKTDFETLNKAIPWNGALCDIGSLPVLEWNFHLENKITY